MASSLQFLTHPWELISTLWSAPSESAATVNLSALTGASGGTGVPASFSALTNVPLVTEQSLAPHGLCGWVASEPGGPGNFVCQAMGQVMPGVVFLVSMVVVSATVFFLMRYFSRTSALVNELENLSLALEKMPVSAVGEWAQKNVCEKIISELLRSGKQIPPLHDFAKRLELSTYPFPSAGKDCIVLKEPVSVIAAQVRKAERWSGQSLAEALPGWLTAIGLLTTFIAILLGLQGVKVLTNLEVRGIGGLVNGLSGKFFSSIIALGCAISITITQYFVSGSTQLRWTRLTDRLQTLIPHLSVERIFLEMVHTRKSER